MSLTSGLASLASSTSKIGRFMFGGDTIEETSEDDDSDDVSTDGEPNDGGTTDGGDFADGAPKGEVSDGSFAGSVSGYDISTKEGSLEGKYDDKVDVNKGLLKMKGNDGATAGAAFHVGLQTPVPVSCHSPDGSSGARSADGSSSADGSPKDGVQEGDGLEGQEQL